MCRNVAAENQNVDNTCHVAGCFQVLCSSECSFVVLDSIYVHIIDIACIHHICENKKAVNDEDECHLIHLFEKVVKLRLIRLHYCKCDERGKC